MWLSNRALIIVLSINFVYIKLIQFHDENVLFKIFFIHIRVRLH